MVVEGQPFKDQFAQVTDSGRAVPKKKRWHASTRENSQDKWKIKHTPKKDNKYTVGALEIRSEPSLDFHETYKPMLGSEEDDELWKKAQAAWKTEGLRKELIEASKGVPVETCCCIIPDDEKHIKDMEPYLNKHFVPVANEKLKKHGFEVDAFLWWWHNAMGKSETVILLIRFFEVDES